MLVGHEHYRHLTSRFPDDWTSGERLVALLIADLIPDRARQAWIAQTTLCDQSGMSPVGLRKVLAKLAERGYDFRVATEKGADGRAVFASRGRSVIFQMVTLPPTERPPQLPKPPKAAGPRWRSRTPIPALVRALVMGRDGHMCVQCSATCDLTLDHIWPWSRGGTHDPANLQVLCRSCNSRKGAKV